MVEPNDTLSKFDIMARILFQETREHVAQLFANPVRGIEPPDNVRVYERG